MPLGRVITAIAIVLAYAATTSFASSSVVEYSYDAAGNIIQIKRQSPSSFAITGFDPGSGAVGTAVTIYGAGFSATPASNAVAFNGVAATVSASAAGSISTTVPAGATTGRITVTVASATATSAQDFVVVVPGAPTITSFTPGSGASGTSVSVVGTNFNTTSGATVVKLNGVTATSSVASTTSLSFTVPGATGSGRVTATTSAGTGMSASDFIVPPPGISATDIVASRRLTNGGAAESITVYAETKHALLLFDGAADEFYTLQFNLFESSPTSASVAYKIYKPDNTLLDQGTLGHGIRTTIHVPKLPAAGTYSVLISPGLATLNTQVKLAADTVLTIDGATSNSGLYYQNQTKRYVFTATAGQYIGMGVTGLIYTPSSPNNTPLKVYKPDGTLLGAGAVANCNAATTQGNCEAEFQAPVAGTYQLIAESPINTYATFGAQLNSEVTGTLTADAPQSVTLTRVGQDSRHTFTAAAGDSVAIDIAGIVPGGATEYFNVSVFKPAPDGSLLTTCSALPPAGGYCELGTLTTAGVYTVTVDPTNGAYGPFKLTLKQGPLITTADAAANFAATANGETVRFRMSPTLAQNLSIGLASLANNPAGSTQSNLKVYGPTQAQWGGTVSCSPVATRCKNTLVNAPSTGTYSVVVQPQGGFKVSGNLSISADLTGTLTSGVAQSLNATRVGQNARFTFSGTAGDNVAVKVYGVTTSPSGEQLKVTVYKPDGNAYPLAVAYTSPPGFVDLGTLAATGTYTVLIEPALGITWQAQVKLDPGTALTVDGSTATLSSAASEPLRYRFTGTAGQRVEIGLSGLAYSPTTSASTSLYLDRPDGVNQANIACTSAGAGSCEIAVVSLPSTGTYALVLPPPGNNAINGGTLAVSTPATGTLTVGGSSQTIAVSRPGQTTRFTFSGTAAQLLRLNWSGTTVSGGAAVIVSVLRPDGSTLSSSSFATGATGGFDIASLPTTGTYTVVMDPASAATFSAATTLVTR